MASSLRKVEANAYASCLRKLPNRAVSNQLIFEGGRVAGGNKEYVKL